MISHSKPFIDETDHQAVREALASGMLAQGKRVQQFEEAVAAYVGWTGGVAENRRHCGPAYVRSPFL